MDEDLLGLYPSDNDDFAMDALNQLFAEPNINRAISNTRSGGTRDGSRDRRRRSKSKRDISNKRESSRREERTLGSFPGLTFGVLFCVFWPCIYGLQLLGHKPKLSYSTYTQIVSQIPVEIGATFCPHFRQYFTVFGDFGDNIVRLWLN